MLFLQIWLATIILSLIIYVLVVVSIIKALKDTLKDEYDEFKRQTDKEEIPISEVLVMLLIPLFNLFIAISAMSLRYEMVDKMIEEFHSKKRFTTFTWSNEDEGNKEN